MGRSIKEEEEVAWVEEIETWIQLNPDSGLKLEKKNYKYESGNWYRLLENGKLLTPFPNFCRINKVYRWFKWYVRGYVAREKELELARLPYM